MFRASACIYSKKDAHAEKDNLSITDLDDKIVLTIVNSKNKG